MIQACLFERVLVDGGDDLLGAGAVFGRHAVFEVAGDGLQAIPLVADDPQPAAPAVDVLAGEAEPGVQVGEVVDQFVERIGFVLERGGDGQAVALAEEADDPAAQRGHAGGIHQAEPPPEQGDAGAGGQLAADGDERALGAIGGQDLALDGLPEGDAVPVHRHAQGEVRNADQGEDALGLVLER